MEALLTARGCVCHEVVAKFDGNTWPLSLHRQKTSILSLAAPSTRTCLGSSGLERIPSLGSLYHSSNLENVRFDSPMFRSRNDSGLCCVPARHQEHLMHPDSPPPMSFADSEEASSESSWEASRNLPESFQAPGSFPDCGEASEKVRGPSYATRLLVGISSSASFSQEEATTSPSIPRSRSAGSLQEPSWTNSDRGGVSESDVGVLPRQVPPPVVPGESLLHPPPSLHASLCISAIEAAPLSVPLIAPFKIASSSVTSADNVAIRVTLSDGAMGFGEVPVLPGVTVQDQAQVLRIIGTAVQPWLRSQAQPRHQDPQAFRASCEEDFIAQTTATCHEHELLQGPWTEQHLPQRALTSGPSRETGSVSAVRESQEQGSRSAVHNTMASTRSRREPGEEDAFTALLRSLRRLEGEVLPGHDFAAVRAGVEMAVLDAVARAAGVPLWRLFGERCHSVTTDITIPLCSVEEARALAELYRSRGFQSIKLKVGQGLPSAGPTADSGHINCMEDADEVGCARDVVFHDLLRIEAIFRAHPGCSLLLDANGGYTEEETLLLLRRLRGECAERAVRSFLQVGPCNPPDRMAAEELSVVTGNLPQFLEQPVPRENHAAMQHICHSLELHPFNAQPKATFNAHEDSMGNLAVRSFSEQPKSAANAHGDSTVCIVARCPNEPPKGPVSACRAAMDGTVAGGGGMLLVADESCRDAEEALWLAQAGAAHMANIKLAKMGVLGALDLIASVQHHNRTVTQLSSTAESASNRGRKDEMGWSRGAALGLMLGGMVETRLGMGFGAHMAAGLGCFSVVDLDTPLLLASDPVQGGYSMDGPMILFSDEPGAACSINWPPP